MYVCVCKNGSDIRVLKFPFVFSRVSNDRPWLNIKGGPLLHAHNTDRELHTFESITSPKIEVATKRLHHVCPIEDQEEKGEQTNKPKSLGYFGRQKRQQDETLSGRKDLLLWPFIGKTREKRRCVPRQVSEPENIFGITIRPDHRWTNRPHHHPVCYSLFLILFDTNYPHRVPLFHE